MSEILINFSTFLKLIREKTMYKQAEVAEAIGITVQTYSKYENGLREPTIEILYKLSKFFKVNPILFFVKEYPLSSVESQINNFAILSIISANIEMHRSLTRRYLDKYSDLVGIDFYSGYYSKDERNLLRVKSSLFRMRGDLAALKIDLLKTLDDVENETNDLIEEIDKTY